MPDPNSMNTAKGKQFQKIAANVLTRHYKVNFRIEHLVQIGEPPKSHKFDLVSDDGKYVGESKNYSWTEGGNVPSAKMAFLNEAVFYLQQLSKNIQRFVVMRKDIDLLHHENETLAEYYFRTNKHLLRGVFIVEIDVSTNEVREFRY